MSIVDKISHYQRNLETCGDNEDRVCMYSDNAITRYSSSIIYINTNQLYAKLFVIIDQLPIYLH